MIQRLKKLRSLILEMYPQSQLRPVSDAQMEALLKRFPDIPYHLHLYLKLIGFGTIGASNFSVHIPFEAHHIFDIQEASHLADFVLLGDDFAGTFEAYDTCNNWQLACVDEHWNFEKCEGGNFIQFLEDMYGSLSN